LLNSSKYESVLVVSATEMEVEPLFHAASTVEQQSRNYFQLTIQGSPINLLITGVGIPQALFETANILLAGKFQIAIQVGIAGSFIKNVLNGEVVVIAEDQFGDLGIENNDGFRTLFEAGFAMPDLAPFMKGCLQNPLKNTIWLPDNIKKVRGLTVNLVTSNKDLILQRVTKFNAEVETMESAAFFYSCLRTGTAFISLRGISNMVGEADKSKWFISEAIQNSCNSLIEIVQKNNFFQNET
jgi:futalosine hydrolase